MRVILAVGILFLLAGEYAVAATKTFNVASGNWSVSGNWSPAGVPANADSVVIPNARTCTFYIAADTCQGMNVIL